jgi:pentatricopeptide repeat protein
MTAAGVPSNSITYTCLIEAAVLSGDVDMAQRVFARAMAAGVTNSVQVQLPDGARHQGTICQAACWLAQHTKAANGVVA